MGLSDGKQGGVWHLEMVDGLIGNIESESGIRSGESNRIGLDNIPKLPRHGANGDIRP